MEGLEASEVTFSNSLGLSKFSGRFEAEFFLKKYDKYYSNLTRSGSLFELTEKTFITDGEHGNAITFPVGFAKYYGARNVLDGILNDNDVEYITEEHHQKIRKSKLLANDILISCVGANVGFAAIVPDYVGQANIVRNVALIRSTDKSLLNQYLLAYFKSNYGKNFFKRMATGNAQPLVSLDYIKTIPVYHPSFRFQSAIKDIVENSKSFLVQSKSLYTDAENILLAELGLLHWQPTRQSYSTKTFAESYQSSGRLDAEYYQPKYDEIENLVRSYKGGYDTTENICAIKLSNFTPKTEQEYKYIELASITANGIIADVTIGTGAELPTRARRLVATNDVIVSSIEGSLTSCAIIPESLNNAICSTGFYVVNSEKINSETLLLLFKSVLVYPMQKGCSGTILTGINNEEFFKIEIPIIDKSTQSQIAAKIQQSFALQQQSKQLLEAAKTAVEIAIEKDEGTAIKYLKSIQNDS